MKKYEMLAFIAMFYVAVDLSSMVFTYKLIEYHSINYAASSIIFPLTYSIMDVIAEVYGYFLARKIILFSFVCDIFFVAIAVIISHIPSPMEDQTVAYFQVFGLLSRAVFAQAIGVLLGALVNIYLISKWKSLTYGKYFWLRSIGSSIFGEGVMLIVSVLIALTGILSYSKLFDLIVFTYLYKIIFAISIAPFLNIIVFILKSKKLGQEKTLDFNPFSDKSDSLKSSANFQNA